MTVNQWVTGSSPVRGAKHTKGLQEIVSPFLCLKTAMGKMMGKIQIVKDPAFSSCLLMLPLADQLATTTYCLTSLLRQYPTPDLQVL